MTGDALTVLLFLIGFAGSALIGALALQGWRALLTWTLFALFLIAAAWWWLRPPIPSLQAVQWLTASVPIMSAGIAALVVSGSRYRSFVATPAVNPLRELNPNTPLSQAITYIRGSAWGQKVGAGEREAIRAMRDRLAHGQIIAFGRYNSEDAIFTGIPQAEWEGLTLDPQTNSAEAINDVHLGRWFDIQVEMDTLKSIWQPERGRNSWMAH